MIRIYEPDLSGREREYLLDAFDSSWISSQGAYLDKFETAVADFIGTPHAASVSNGTVALHLALHCLGIGPGDEVIVPSFTYIASVNAIVQTGALPVFAESRRDNWLLDVDHAESLITPRTKAIMPVHLYSSICEMDHLVQIADKHGIDIIEDCAESLGAFYKGKHAGTFGKVSTFSFFGNKTATTGEGGMVITSDPQLHRRMVTVKGQGQDPTRRYWHTELGFNYRMTNLAAAIGLAQVERLQDTIERKREIARQYAERLPSNTGLVFQAKSADVITAEWLVSVLVPSDVNRDEVMKIMAEAGVETRPVFHCAHKMPPHLREHLSLPVAEEISARGISLPSYPKLSNEQVAFVANALVEAMNMPRAKLDKA